MIAWESPEGDARTEGAGRIKRTYLLVSKVKEWKCASCYDIPPVKYTPDSSETNRDKPIPIGARKLPLCFSTARMRMVKTSSAVRNISMTATA